MDRSVSSRRRTSHPQIAFAAFGLLCTGILGGCVETTAMSGAETPEPRARLARARLAPTSTASASPSPVSAAFRSRWKIE